MDASFEKAIAELEPWIGRQRVVDDEIGLSSVRRIAAMLDVDPAAFEVGTPLPRHWFTMFFPDAVRQSEIGADGHPAPGVLLPPIPLPRRMGAGRRVRIDGTLAVAQAARKVVEVVSIVPKLARTGHIAVLTMRHTIESNGQTVAVDEFDAVYREAVPVGEKSTATVPRPAPQDGVWTSSMTLSEALVFRYSAVTWNAHRIHYDADYARGTEGYPATVQNGGLTMQLMLDAAMSQTSGDLVGFTARLTRPLWVGDVVTLAGKAVEEGIMECWAADAEGAQCAQMSVEVR
ncbi:MAG: 3-methylfumaryl-CoA hydratase [Gammaproteobacteria bacterium]